MDKLIDWESDYFENNTLVNQNAIAEAKNNSISIEEEDNKKKEIPYER